jgi:hypothetical protein
VWGWVRRGVPRGFAARGGGSRPGNVARLDSYRPFGSSFWLLFFLTCQTKKQQGGDTRCGPARMENLDRFISPPALGFLFFAFLSFTFLSREDSSRETYDSSWWQESPCHVFIYLFLSFIFLSFVGLSFL